KRRRARAGAEQKQVHRVTHAVPSARVRQQLAPRPPTAIIGTAPPTTPPEGASCLTPESVASPCMSSPASRSPACSASWPPPPAGPLSPREELATFRIAKGFRAELVASEPDVIDPVAMAFDEDGRLFVCEMRGYPNDGVATGTITSGRIKLLEDRDGDGAYET